MKKHTIFTSVNLNYLSRAKILADSIKAHSPNIHFVVVLSEPNLIIREDEIKLIMDKCESFDEVILLCNLSLELNLAVQNLLVTEICTMVKAETMIKLLGRENVEYVTYLDPDIVVYDDVERILSEHKNDFCCIIAGYEDDIKHCFFNQNQGLERRFPWVHKIDDYSNENMAEIFLKMVKDIKWNLAKELDVKYLNDFFKNEKDEFSNFGGSIETFLSKIKMCHAHRVFALENEQKFINAEENTIVRDYLAKSGEKRFDYMYIQEKIKAIRKIIND
jgi:hypothetical protein